MDDNSIDRMPSFSQLTFISHFFSNLLMFSFNNALASICPKVAAKDTEDEKPTNVEAHANVGYSGHCGKMGNNDQGHIIYTIQ